MTQTYTISETQGRTVAKYYSGDHCCTLDEWCGQPVESFIEAMKGHKNVTYYKHIQDIDGRKRVTHTWTTEKPTTHIHNGRRFDVYTHCVAIDGIEHTKHQARLIWKSL
jgi:hypothetical protein